MHNVGLFVIMRGQEGDINIQQGKNDEIYNGVFTGNITELSKVAWLCIKTWINEICT